MTLCLLPEGLRATGLCDGTGIPLGGFSLRRFGLEALGGMDDEGVEESGTEFKVDEEWVVEMVAVDRSDFLELLGDFSVLRSAFLLRRSLKNGIPTGARRWGVVGGFRRLRQWSGLDPELNFGSATSKQYDDTVESTVLFIHDVQWSNFAESVARPQRGGGGMRLGGRAAPTRWGRWC